MYMKKNLDTNESRYGEQIFILFLAIFSPSSKSISPNSQGIGNIISTVRTKIEKSSDYNIPIII